MPSEEVLGSLGHGIQLQFSWIQRFEPMRHHSAAISPKSDRLGPHMLQAPGMPPLTHPPPMWRPGYGRAQTWSTTPSSARPSFVRRASRAEHEEPAGWA